MIIDIRRRRKKCPKCGGEVCDILYGMPTPTYGEDYENQTGHRVILGGCFLGDDMPQYECADCGLQLRRLSFPSDAKQLALSALEEESGWTDNVEYIGIYDKKLVYRPIVKAGVFCDALVLVFVDQLGGTSKMTGFEIMDVINKITFGKGHGIMIP